MSVPLHFECVCSARITIPTDEPPGLDEQLRSVFTRPSTIAAMAAEGWKPWEGMSGFYLCPKCPQPGPAGRGGRASVDRSGGKDPR